MGCPMVLDGPAAGGAPDFEKVRTDSTEVPKIPPPGDAWLVPRISMHGACTNYPCASNSYGPASPAGWHLGGVIASLITHVVWQTRVPCDRNRV